MRIHVAGLIALAGWMGLAWVSRAADHPLWLFLAIHFFLWLAWAWAYREVVRGKFHGSVWTLVAWAAAFRLCGGFAWPIMEDDYFRFLWDGYQFASTGNPYAAAPAEFFADRSLPEPMEGVLDQVNYPHVPTIYGPVCQALFLASYLVAPAQLWPWKVALIVFDLGLVVLGLVWAGQRAEGDPRPSSSEAEPQTDFVTANERQWTRIRGYSPVFAVQNLNGSQCGFEFKDACAGRAVLILGWAPLMVFETSFNAHPDILGVALLAASIYLRGRRMHSAAGLALGLAVGAKVFALPLAPFLLQRSMNAWRAFLLSVLAVYLPFWLQGSAADLGALIVYSKHWEFNSSLFAVVQRTLGPSAARALCGAIFFGVWLMLLRASSMSRHAEWNGLTSRVGLVLFAAFFLLSPTVNAWYLLWLAPFLARHHSWTALAAWILVPLSYVTGMNLAHAELSNFAHPVWVRWLEYGGIALVGTFEFYRSRVSKPAEPVTSDQ